MMKTGVMNDYKCYYEKVGDSYQKLDHMPGDGKRDRLGLDRKTPYYEEVLGKETKLES